MEYHTKTHDFLFKNRKQAGKELALLLRNYKNTDSIILALPRGGVPIAAEISHVINIPMEILAVRKIGVPVFSEIAAGAICEDDKPYFSENILLRLGFTTEDLDEVVETETLAIKRQINLFRNGRKLPKLAKKNVIVVDDGVATGATLQAAIHYLKKQNVAKVIVAVPVGSASALKSIRQLADEVICPHDLEHLLAVSQFYEDFSEVKDEEVISLCNSHRFKGIPDSPMQSLIESKLAPLKKTGDLNALVQSLKDTRVVMLGEASHGTHEYYQMRSMISKKLIEDHGFNFIAVEGNWPDADRLNRYIKSTGGQNSVQVLLKNHRGPTWMWANHEVAKLAEWLHGRDVGFHGLDVYSLFESIDEISYFLQTIDPKLAQLVAQNYGCFDPFDRDEIEYARSLLQFPEGCEKEVLQNLKTLLQLRLENSEELFSAQQNARIIANAESYYRSMAKSDENSWNIRDTHMLDTLDQLLDRYGEGSKAIIWAHNTHIGDYRATDMLKHGYINIGGMARERYGAENVKLVGFGSYQGKVLAGEFWGADEQIMNLPPARENSIEWHCHQVALRNKLNRFHIKLGPTADPLFKVSILHRAVGVVYDPTREYRSNYVPSELANRYDDFIFIDRTNALSSLHSYADTKEFPETWPFGD